MWLPSGGSLVIDRTEAMTVIDVNTGKFTGQGGNLEETVTRNNLEAAEEIVRQLRLRDVGGIVVIDFIDMVLESNRELVLRRLLECLARDRTKHQVAEVTSLGLVQMTRKRVGAGLIEAFSQQCECCNGRGVIITLDAPAEPAHRASAGTGHRPVPAPPSHAPGNGNGNGQGNGAGNAKAGYGNGRRGNGRRDDDRGARDAYPDTAPPADLQAGTQAEPAQASTAQASTAQASTATARGPTPRRQAAATAPTATAPAARRSTSAGTAFATAVLVDDTPALVPVVTTVPQASRAGPGGLRCCRDRRPGHGRARGPVRASGPPHPGGLGRSPGHGGHRAGARAGPVPADAGSAAQAAAEATVTEARRRLTPRRRRRPRSSRQTDAAAMTAGVPSAARGRPGLGRSGAGAEPQAALGIEPAIVAASVFDATPAAETAATGQAGTAGEAEQAPAAEAAEPPSRPGRPGDRARSPAPVPKPGPRQRALPRTSRPSPRPRTSQPTPKGQPPRRRRGRRRRRRAPGLAVSPAIAARARGARRRNPAAAP